MAKSRNWVRVSQRTPCPKCKQFDWCCVSADGSVAKCMRVEEGCFQSGEDRNGAPYHLHRLTDGSQPDAVPLPQPGTCRAQRADADTLHAVYSALLGQLSLKDTHKKNLEGRGLGEPEIERRGYQTLAVQGRWQLARRLREHFGEQLLRVPGFLVKEKQGRRFLTLAGAAGLVVPCRDLAGRIIALKVRRDEPFEGDNRYTYISSAGKGGVGPGSPVHAPLGTPLTAERVRLTEGELKADVIHALTGVPTLSVPGSSNWRPALAVLKEMGCKTVCLAFDMDAWHKPVVARSLSACADGLVAAGFTVELERWNPADGKGLDDLLKNEKTPELLQGEAAGQAIREILAAATAGEEPAEADDLERLDTVVNEGGAEALFRDKALLRSLAELAETDSASFAAVRSSLRDRVSVRDLDGVLRPLRKEVRTETAGESSPTYFEQDGCIHRNVFTKDGPVSLPLCNFSARIVEDVVHDDGAERACFLAVEGKLANGLELPRTEVASADFANMGWVVPAWGTRAVVYAGQGTKDHLRTGLQLLSGNVPRRTIYGHVGWRQVGEEWLYLHAGGAIGVKGLTSHVPVSLPEPLAGFQLPDPPPARIDAAGGLWESAGETSVLLADAVRASLGILGLGPDRITFPLLATVYRAVLGDTDFALHLAGPTGCFKSELAALGQQHFGSSMDARHLPASWSSTANALEALAFAAKDTVLVVDDFCPSGSAADVQRYHREADRLFRGQGNHSGRQRMRADSTLRPAKPPRGTILSTGEDVPRGQSLRARMLSLDISPGDLGSPSAPNPGLSACQKDAAEGKYAGALAGFIRWLAPQYEDIRQRLRREGTELREQARKEGQHARTPGIVADLALGLRYLLAFARSIGAITEAERTALGDRGWNALAEAAAAQAAHIATGEPATLFLRLLSAAIAGGYAHVADRNGNAPSQPQCWGWRPEEFYTGEGTDTRLKPQGILVGWLAEDELFLEPETSFAVVQRFAREQGEGFAITAHTLRRRLKEKGLLETTDTARGKLTVRRTLQGVRRDVLHLVRDALSPAPQTGPTGPDEEDADEGGPLPGADPWATIGHREAEPAQTSSMILTATGRVGRKGRSAPEKEQAPVASSNGKQADEWGETE